MSAVAKTYGAALHGVNATMITTEVNVGDGTGFYVSGLPDKAIQESEHRIESSIREAEFWFPRNKTVVNLAPADIRKEGSAYDLPIALCLLQSSGQIRASGLEQYLIMGELSLDGTVRPIKGMLPIAIEARKNNLKGVIVPPQNASEAAIVNKLDVFPVESLKEAIGFLEGSLVIEPIHRDTRDIFFSKCYDFDVDFKEVQGQQHIKRALEIAAAGGHNAIMIGPPGAGKTMLAKRIPSILPPLSLNEALETTKIHSVAGKLPPESSLVAQRPFRSPHHTISDVALVSGGGYPQPGEISLAHNGVLFLDELPEFKRSVLEVMRQPMEERRVTISRARFNIDYPANFMLIASMNPCPCGFYNHPEKECICGPGTVQRYLSRLSGPLLDRIDLHVEVTPVPFSDLSLTSAARSSEEIRESVIAARTLQIERFNNLEGVYSNAMMSPSLVRETCTINNAGRTLLKTAMDKLGLSARAFDRILKVSRTIADLAGKEAIMVEHLAEAIQYRSLDRENWAHQ